MACDDPYAAASRESNRMAIFSNLEYLFSLKLSLPGLPEALGCLRRAEHYFPSDAGEGYTSTVEMKSGLRVLPQVYRPCSREKARYESHLRYIDLQYVHVGEEIIWVAHTDSLSIETSYNDVMDCQYYAAAEGSALLLRSGQAAIFLPDDGHAPGLRHSSDELVYKIVVKIPVQ